MFSDTLLPVTGKVYIVENSSTPLYSSDVVYRPIRERKSVLLELTSGCSWAKCAFCDFIRDEYRVFPIYEIEEKAIALKNKDTGQSRLFLLGQNSFSLSTAYLLEVFAIIRRHLPHIEEISMYARADAILRKTPSELSFLYSRGLRELHIGVESGCDEVLALVGKGVTAGEMETAFRMLEDAQIAYSVTSILGLGGKRLSDEHAMGTAALYNKIAPVSIWCLALKIWPDLPLTRMVDEGVFVPCTYREILVEERLMLSNMEYASGQYMDTTALGKYTLRAKLPEGRQDLIDSIDLLLDTNS